MRKHKSKTAVEWRGFKDDIRWAFLFGAIGSAAAIFISLLIF